MAIVGSYLLQVIDANVFAYMQDFEVNEDLTMKVSPAVIPQYNEFAIAPVRTGGSFMGNNAVGVKIGLTF